MADQQDIAGGGVLPSGVQGGVVPGPGSPAAGAAGGAISFTDHGGPVLHNAHLVLIFWGSAWSGAPAVPSSSIVGAINNIVNGLYMNWLSQYRGIGHASIQTSHTVTSAVGSSPGNPPNPFSDSDVQTLVSNLINAGQVPAPSSDPQLLYVVFLPQGVGNAAGNFIGEHTFFNFNGTNCHFAWVLNFGNLDSITSIFSHELVESVTDPEGNAITGDPGSCNQSGWCEIGDVCTGNTVTINGVVVQRYWSQNDSTCVPTDKQIKDQKDTKEPKDVKDHKIEVKETKDHKPEIKELKDKHEIKEHKDKPEIKEIKDHKPEIKEVKEHKPEIKEVKDKDIKDKEKEVKEKVETKEKFEIKEHKEKEVKEKVEIKEQKEKEIKEVKEPKEIVEGSPVGQPGDPFSVSQKLDDLAGRLSRIEQSLAGGQAFIRPEERPPVGEGPLNQPDSPAGGQETEGPEAGGGATTG